jgi:hypothetical protein
MGCLASAFVGWTNTESRLSPFENPPVQPHVVLWILRTSQLAEFDETMLLLGARVAARQDDVECFEMLRASWISQTAPLRAGPHCARLAKMAGVPLHPSSEEELQRILDRQVAAAIVLRDALSRELLLDIMRRADFLWVPA